jgi:biopolymer transport protein ExbD
MHIRDAAHEGESNPINLTSMMDMVFNLLIFFLVATTIVQEEQDLAVKLPETTQAPRDPANPPRQLVINIRDDGLLVVAGRSYDAAALSQMLSQVAKEQPPRNILIRADERSTFKHFASVVDLCRRSGVAEARIGYLQQQPSAAP